MIFHICKLVEFHRFDFDYWNARFGGLNLGDSVIIAIYPLQLPHRFSAITSFYANFGYKWLS
jgi:hypothetical protein